jgi:magnesium-transporting ATPase (P-type)
LFFLITVNDYSFFLLLNVAIFALTGIIGVTFLYQVMKPISDNDGDQGVKVRKNILRFWLVLYGFVGSQLGWTLRPFFGSQGQFELFRPREGSFFSGVWNALLSLFS